MFLAYCNRQALGSLSRKVLSEQNSLFVQISYLINRLSHRTDVRSLSRQNDS